MSDESAAASGASEDLFERVMAAQRRIYRAMEAAHQSDWVRCELTMAQLKVLMRVPAEGRQHLGDVAEALGIGLPTASHLVDRLVRQGLLQRREDPEDRRYVLVARTAAGEDLVDRLRRAGKERWRAWLGRLQPAELRALALGLEALGRVAAGESR